MSVTPILSAVISRFPDKEEVISHLYATHDDFREVCEDYYLCLNSIIKIREIERSDQNPTLLEFECSRADLEDEILSMITINQSRKTKT